MKRLQNTMNKIEDNEIKNFYTQLRLLQDYVIKLKEEDSNITVKKVKEKIYSEIYDVHMIVHNQDGISVLASSKNDLFFLKTIKSILRNTNMILEVYDKLNKQEKKLLVEDIGVIEYGENTQDNIITILNNVVGIQKQKYKDKIQNLSEADKEELKENIYVIVRKMIEQGKMEQSIKKSYIHRLAMMISFLDKLGALESYNELNNKRLERMDLKEELGFLYENKKGTDYKLNTVLDLKNEKSLENLSIDELTILISFYLNRIEKVTQNIEKVFFTLEKRALLGKFFKGENVEPRITENQLRVNLAQFEFLSDISDELLLEYASTQGDKIVFYDENNILNLLKKDDERAYKAFSKMQDKTLQADLKKDLIDLQNYSSYKNNLYYYKDAFMEIMMYNLLTSPKEVNWGYVEESNKFQNGKNSIQNKRKNILIKADIKGFNNPIMLHYNLEKLKRFMRNYNKTQNIPVYIGEDDFSVQGKNGAKLYMSNFILMPIQSSRMKRIKKKAEKIESQSPYYKYIKHLAWISSPKSIPKHLLRDGRKLEKNVDLTTGNIYEQEVER